MYPMLIFPRKKENPAFLANKPPGAWAVFDPSGWMCNHIFTDWLKKFIIFSKASATNPVMLILDGHGSHVKNLDVIELARANNVTILCLPPHCSNKMQPLDVGFMKPLSTFYSEAVTAFQKKNQRVTIKDIFGLFGIAYMKAAKIETAVNSFKKCGIYPFNDKIFTDADFVASQRSNIHSNTNDSDAEKSKSLPQSNDDTVPDTPRNVPGNSSETTSLDCIDKSITNSTPKKIDETACSSSLSTNNSVSKVSEFKNVLHSLTLSQADEILQNIPGRNLNMI